MSRRLLLLVCACVPLSVTEASGLLGHWKFDEGTGDVARDSSGHENDGEVWDAHWVKGTFGTALHFGGKGAHVSIPQISALDGSDEMTVEAWVYWEGTSRYPNIFTGGLWSPGGLLIFVRDHECTFRMGRPGYSAAKDRKRWRETSAALVRSIALEQWYHLAATFKRPVIRTYVNGQQVVKGNWDYPVGHKDDIVVGKWSGGVGHHGLIDEVKLYNRALTPDEIAASYQIEAHRRPQARTAYQRLVRKPDMAAAAAVIQTDFAKLVISRTGRCTALIDKRSGRDRILRTLPLVTLKRDGKTYRRASCTYQAGELTFRFPKADATVGVGVTGKARYFVFDVRSVTGDVDEVTFLALSLKSCPYVHNMSGLAADDEFGVCLRTLNLRTRCWLGRREPILSAMAQRDLGIVGAKAALVACPVDQMRVVLKDVVRDEALPYSPLGGPFALDAEQNRGSYVFARVSEANVDQWIDLARRGGIDCIHQSGWGESLGHYVPRKALFPNGLEGMKAVADKIHAAGLKIGIHTLTGCISPHDSWVRPVPDRRLTVDASFTLTVNVGVKDTTLATSAAPGNLPTIWAYSSRGNCLRIDDELVQYSAISNDPPYGFLNCKRGAFGTKPAAHGKGSTIGHLLVRYGCFQPDEKSTLVDEVADAIANVYNTCGLDQIYMDGAEAMRGWYGIARMRHAIYTRLQRPALVEASCWGHHSWPFHSRVGAWDHPKWGLKRFADDHLAAVQQYRKACLLEAQLGWWVILGPGRDWDMEMPDEIEYLCAKALGHDVPLSFQGVSVGAKAPNARQTEYFTTIGRYERLRLANYFSETVKEKLREERQEFRLNQADDGEWQVVPTDYSQHKVTGLDDGTSIWTATNRFASQPIKLRIQALYSAFPYNDEQALTIAEFTSSKEFASHGSARDVRYGMQPVTTRVKVGEASARFTAQNRGESRVGAWARALKEFDPVINLSPHDAIGLWVHGDGKGELLNLQLTNLPEYFHTRDDHYIKVDFEGWRYFELLLRERDAAAYHDYQWPYGAHCVLHRSPLVRHAVNKLTIYLNNLPPNDRVECYLSPIKALRSKKVILRNPSIQAGGRRLVFPVDLQSGMYIEFESTEDCRLYDERGNLVKHVRPTGEVPLLAAGDSTLAFSCTGTDGFNSRAEVTVITAGKPVRGRNSEDKINWDLLKRDYEYPRTISSLDGRQNQWQVLCPPHSSSADVEVEITVDEVGGSMTAYNAPNALRLESFETPDPFAQTPDNQFAKYVYDSHHRNRACKPGVTQKLSQAADVVKIGKASGCYSAISTRQDKAGWSSKGKRFKKPVDLSKFAAIGFWLHGDGNGQLFKLQLRDTAGGWQDMYTKVSFTGWRYCQFDLGGPHLNDLGKVEYLIMYYNGIPAGRTVTCHIDEVRALRTASPLRDPTLAIGDQRILFPVQLGNGDRLVFKAIDDCKVLRKLGQSEPVKPVGPQPRLKPGRNPVTFSLPKSRPSEFRALVSLTKVYP